MATGQATFETAVPSLEKWESTIAEIDRLFVFINIASSFFMINSTFSFFSLNTIYSLHKKEN
jgi:hypothetical protein